MKTEIQSLFAITKKLREKYKKYGKNFTLDGRLVGDIGEVLAAEEYGLELYDENTEIYDGRETATGRKVQVKASFKGYFQFPYGEERIPDYYLAVMITEEGKLEEVYNGPGRFLFEQHIVADKKKPYKESYYSLTRGKLAKVNAVVDAGERIGRKIV